MLSKRILLGFEVGTGESVYMDLAHTVVTGMTQLSGKTTTLQAIIDRSGLRAIAFKTKRGEAGFNNYHGIPPYFIEQSDWKYVSGILEAYLHEKVKFERSWIMKATKNTRSLKDVLRNVQALREKSHGLSESVYSVLEQYLIEIIPQIERFTFSKTLSLTDGINVMDLSEMTLEMRLLVIRSVMEQVIEKMHSVIVIIPEAWEAIPQGRNTPVKLYAEIFIRKGAAIGNYLFIDSQDIAGIDKTPLRQCNNWIMGRQRETHEIDRVREVIGKKINEDVIRTLRIGHFIAAIGDDLRIIYVLPTGVPEEMGRSVALGKALPQDVAEWLEAHSKKDVTELTQEEKAELNRLREEVRVLRVKPDAQDEIKKIEAEAQHLVGVASDEKTKAEKALLTSNEMLAAAGKEITRLSAKLKDAEAGIKIVEALKAIIPQTPTSGSNCSTQPLDLAVQGVVNRVEVTHTLRRVELTTETFAGKIAYLYATGRITERIEHRDIKPLFDEKGWGFSNAQVSEAMKELMGYGLFMFKPRGTAPGWAPTATAKELSDKGMLKVQDVIA